MTNSIELTFATILLRTAKTRSYYSVEPSLALMHQLAISVLKRRRRERDFKQQADVIACVRFIAGSDENEVSRKAAALCVHRHTPDLTVAE